MQKIFQVYDVKAEAFLIPFFSPTAGIAIRSFSEAANSAESNFHKYAADYTLFEVGQWDEQSGNFDIYGAKINLGEAITFIEQPQAQLEAIPNHGFPVTNISKVTK